jgi:hypothetical protein
MKMGTPVSSECEAAIIAHLMTLYDYDGTASKDLANSSSHRELTGARSIIDLLNHN